MERSKALGLALGLAVGLWVGGLVFVAPTQAGLFDVIDEVDERIQKTEDKVDQTTGMKDSTERIKQKTGDMVPEREESSPPPPPGSRVEYFFESIEGGQKGISASRVADEVAKGRIQRDTLVWTEGMDDWTPASKVPALKSHFPARPPPLPGKR